MLCRSTIGALALKVAPLAAALAMVVGAVAAGEEIKYPDWKGQWRGVLRIGTFGGQPSNEAYFLSADGLLMPTRKDQPPPDLRYYKQTRK